MQASRYEQAAEPEAAVRTIRRVDILSDDDQQRLFRWTADPFGVAHLGLTWRQKEIRFILAVDGEPVSHVGLVRHVVRAGDQTVDVAGVGGVVTVPDAQGRGHAAALMTHAAAFARDDWRVHAGLLFCLPRMIPYYAGLGWRTLSDPVMIQQPARVIAAPIPAMVLPFRDGVWPDGAVTLGSLPW